MAETVGTTIALSGKTCIHSGPEYGPAFHKANSYYCPVGPHPGHAWVLLTKADLDSISSLASHTLAFVESTDTDGRTTSTTTLSISPLYLVNSLRVFRGKADDPDSIHLVHLVDVRSLGRYSTIDNGVYNIRSYANDTTYLTGATGFTWDTILSSLWGELPSVFGSWPGLPAGYTPDGTPEDFRYHGVNAWTALHEVLRKISCTTAYDPTIDTFTVVRLGAAQTVAGLPVPEWDAEAVQSDVTEIPETVRVYFHDHYQSYGQERDTELATNWSIKPPYATKDVATSVTDAVTGTILPVWDDLARALDEDNSDSNSAARDARAAQVAANYVLDWQTPRSHKVYQGVITAAQGGSRVKSVLWRHWGDGMQTEVVQHPGIPLRRDGPVVDSHGRLDTAVAMTSESIASPDLSRRSYPVYPRLLNVVQVDDGASATGAVLTANGDGLFPGFVRRWVAGSLATLDACWIKPVDLAGGDSPSEATVITLRQKDQFTGRLSGVETSGGSTRAIYMARSGETDWIARGDSGSGGSDQRVFNETIVDFVAGSNMTITIADVAGVRAVTFASTGGAGGSHTVTADAGSEVLNDADTLIVQGAIGSEITTSVGKVSTTVTLSILDDTKVKWAICQSNWEVAATPPCTHVSVKDCADCAGSTPTGVAFDVILPEVAGRDPNLTLNDVIAYRTAEDDTKVIVSDYLDDKILTSKTWSGTVANIAPGWAVMDGTANSVVNGGSGIDMVNFFARGKSGTTAANDTPVGSNTHNHGNTGTKSTGITIDDHDFHSHSARVVEFWGDVGGAEKVWSGEPAVNETTSDEAVTAHVVNETAHDHTTGTSASPGDLPEHKNLHWIERIDNSL